MKIVSQYINKLSLKNFTLNSNFALRKSVCISSMKTSNENEDWKNIRRKKVVRISSENLPTELIQPKLFRIKSKTTSFDNKIWHLTFHHDSSLWFYFIFWNFMIIPKASFFYVSIANISALYKTSHKMWRIKKETIFSQLFTSNFQQGPIRWNQRNWCQKWQISLMKAM